MWVVKSETSQKLYGPFKRVEEALRWVRKELNKKSHWVLVKLVKI